MLNGADRYRISSCGEQMVRYAEMHRRVGRHGAGEAVPVVIRFLIEARALGLGWARTSGAIGVRSPDVEVIFPEGAVVSMAVDVRAIVPDCPDVFA